MTRFLKTLFFTFFLQSAFCQANTYQTTYVAFSASLPEQSSLRQTLASDSLYGTLPPFEKEFIYYLNYARQYPVLFSEKAATIYLEDYPEFKPVYGKSLLSELAKGIKTPVVMPDTRFIKLARSHATDISRHDLMSHNSSNGTQMQQRFENAGVTCGSECINLLSSGEPLEVLLSLLVDFNVPDFGHRKSLLGEKMVVVGVGKSVSPKKLQYTVVDLGCQ